MRTRWRQSWLEWGLVGLLGLLCGTLSLLQYRWTGELSAMESRRLHDSLEEQLDWLSRRFNSELADACLSLLPSAEEVEREGAEAAYRSHYRQWADAGGRPLFSRLAYAVPREGALELWELKAEGSSRLDWPAGWAKLRDQFQAVLAGTGERPRADPASLLIEFPIFGEEREIGWMIFELDQAYISTVWLPELVGSFLNPGPQPNFDVQVTVTNRPDSILFRTGTPIEQAESQVPLFPSDLLRARRHPGRPDGRWTMTVRHQNGSLDSAVAQARWRNLAATGLLLLLTVLTAGTLLRLTRRSRQLAETQFRLLAGVSHELRTPLTVIHGAAFNLRQGLVYKPEAVARYSDLILQHTTQLTEMIEQVLAFATARAGKRTGIAGTVDLAEVLQVAYAAISAVLEEHGCAVEWDLPDGLPPIVGDTGELVRVVQNLVVNAAVHGGDGHWIGISATVVEEFVELLIRDRGPGLPESELPHVFEPFYRGERAYEDQTRGTGLGLSLVKEIVEAYGGSVSAHNDGGAVFTVRLQVA